LLKANSSSHAVHKTLYIPVIAVYWQIVVIYPATLSLISFYATITKNFARLKELE